VKWLEILDNFIDGIGKLILIFIIVFVVSYFIVNFFNMVSDIHQIKEYIITDDVYIEKVGDDNE
jgi:hypothetical protein